MGYWEHYCAGHKKKEDAALWYYRETDEGEREFLCGNQYNKESEKGSWQLVEPADEIS